MNLETVRVENVDVWSIIMDDVNMKGVVNERPAWFIAMDTGNIQKVIVDVNITNNCRKKAP